MKYLQNSLHLLVIATLTLRVAARWPSSYTARQQVNAGGAAAGAASGAFFGTIPSGVNQIAQNGSSSMVDTMGGGMSSPRPISTLSPPQNDNYRYPCQGFECPPMGFGCWECDQPCGPPFYPCPCPAIPHPTPEICSCFNMDINDPCKCATPFPPCFLSEGGTANQPNIITQSVSLCPTKRPTCNGSSMNLEPFGNSLNNDADAYCEDTDSYAPRTRHFPIRFRESKRKTFWSTPREDDVEYINDEDKYENGLEMRINRIVEMLDRLKAKEDESNDYPRRVPFFSRQRQRNKFQDPEDDEEGEQEMNDEEFEPRKLSQLKSSRRMSRYRKYDEDPESEYVQARKGPKLDWLMLKSKKSPKRYTLSEDEPERKCSRQMKYIAADDDEEEDIRDDRDILFVPERTKSCRQRRYD
ncbi:Hypothetical protein NTJ_05939 [Nesidiocoris tenuis]|uniref:Uncharacterized protein n=1 Tax=Nesidiocoris tenuis TaxID=355587 RepID=A0ABN7ALL3_9HEMI|nr:Hypothetical protein NTJ_05939 [Nesidiocoris tenuis]